MTTPDAQGLQRVPSQFPVHLMKTYQIVAPLATHYRPATCAEYECGPYLHGWETKVPAGSELAEMVRSLKGRWHFTETSEDGTAVFTFPPGQSCFRESEHKLPNGRPERFIERGGDWRGNPARQAREHSADTWVDSFANNMISVKAMHERG